MSCPDALTGRARERQRGFALLAVLWAGAFLALVAGVALHGARSQALVARNLTAMAQAQAAADGAVRLAIAGLLTDPAQATPRDGRVSTVVVGPAAVAVSIQDAGGLVDLNRAPEALMATAAIAAGADPGAALAVARAVTGRRPPPSAPPPAAPPFRSVHELAALPGVSPDLYRRLAPLVGLWSRQAGIDPSTAPAVVLAALPGADPDEVRRAVARREREPGFRPLLRGLEPYLADSRGDAVVIAAMAQVPGGTATRRAAVRLALAAEPGQAPGFRILDWDDDLP